MLGYCCCSFRKQRRTLKLFHVKVFLAANLFVDSCKLWQKRDCDAALNKWTGRLMFIHAHVRAYF